MSERGAGFLAELTALHRAAGLPSFRSVSAGIRRNRSMPDTVSHDTVRAILQGGSRSRWSKVECVVRQLAAMAPHRPDPDLEAIRLQGMWLAEVDVRR